jgi:hypothetical protein
MRKKMRKAMIIAALLGAACSPEPASNETEMSGKTEVALADVPAEVLAAARAAQPEMTPVSAETETRDGRRYYDVEGTLPDGSEIELDIMEEGGSWQVVETQRDIAFAAAPQPVRDAAAAADAGFAPTRVIESVQADGIVIYELFGPGPEGPRARKIEVKWDGARAELLTEEWAH